jgi:hypothetical protein
MFIRCIFKWCVTRWARSLRMSLIASYSARPVPRMLVICQDVQIKKRNRTEDRDRSDYIHRGSRLRDSSVSRTTDRWPIFRYRVSDIMCQETAGRFYDMMYAYKMHAQNVHTQSVSYRRASPRTLGAFNSIAEIINSRSYLPCKLPAEVTCPETFRSF